MRWWEGPEGDLFILAALAIGLVAGILTGLVLAWVFNTNLFDFGGP